VETRGVRLFLRAMTSLSLGFLYLPLVLVVIYAFSKGRGSSWPPELFTTRWFAVAWDDPTVKPALIRSLGVAVVATALALVLGSFAAFAVHRFRFFGRDAISFALVLPIALPGIVTALALNSAVDVSGFGLGIPAVIVGHSTFCIVVVYNNVIARLRRSSASLEEASADLGADTWQTFRHVTFPQLRSALLAGALLAFALSFDEVIVTTFTAGPEQTLPIWILSNLSRPNQLPVVNVVAVFLILLSTIPVYLATRLTRDTGAVAPTAGGAQAAGAR
jgi:putative spermidine/putrescine transport system permease protein